MVFLNKMKVEKRVGQGRKYQRREEKGQVEGFGIPGLDESTKPSI